METSSTEPDFARDSDGTLIVTPIIRDRSTGRELWRTTVCADYCGMTIRTWSSAVSHGRAPKPVGHLDARTPLWDAQEVQTWGDQRTMAQK